LLRSSFCAKDLGGRIRHSGPTFLIFTTKAMHFLSLAKAGVTFLSRHLRHIGDAYINSLHESGSWQRARSQNNCDERFDIAGNLA